MADTFITILTAHLLGDFVPESGWTTRRKQNFRSLLLHARRLTQKTMGLWLPL